MQRQSLSLVSLDEKKAYQLCRRLGTGLSLEEVGFIRSYYRKLKREPTELEIQTIAQTWSEHCFHKIFKSQIKIGKKTIDGLFKEYIKAATDKIQANWIVSAFSDNAGLIKFEETHSIAAKVETHNHPSAIDPFGGAATGIGGVIRDVLGVWAEPIANTDVLCFGDLDLPYSKLPPGTKHAKYLLNGVVAGVGDYGNKMGIPTVNGALCFDSSFNGYTLVFCGCIGLLKNRNYSRTAKPGDVLVIAGARTGREGIHGVNFASEKIKGDTDKLRAAVQIPDPIVEEKLKRAVLEIADRHLASGVTDLGGGGLSSAVCELAKSFGCGADADIASIPLKEQDMQPWEIWVSETQERMLISVPESTLAKVLSVFEREEIEASAFGKLTDTNAIVIRDREQGELAKLDLAFLFSPRLNKMEAKPLQLPAREMPPVYPRSLFQKENLSNDLLELLSRPNIASKERIVRTYDHEVKGNTVLKPFQYPFSGPNDAAVLKPIPNSEKGLAISCGLNPGLGLINPYWMAASAIDEAVRNNIAVGGRRIALLDNFAWGNPEKPEALSGLVSAAQACYDVSVGLGTPFISGKDSLYNASPNGGDVAPTLVITALGIVPDVARCRSSNFKKEGNSIYLVGETKAELAGSEYYKMKKILGGAVPKLSVEAASDLYRAMIRVSDQDFVRSCHDISEGGLAVALAEMCFANSLGADVVLPDLDFEKEPKSKTAEFIFSESNSRFLIEIESGEEDKFEKSMKGQVVLKLGSVGSERIRLKDKNGQNIVNLATTECYRSWTATFS